MRTAGSDGGGKPVARIRLRVAPGSRVAQVVGPYGDGWKVRVQAAPERGRANEEVRALVASLCGVRATDVQVVAGAASRDKLVSVTGIDFEQLSRVLDAASGK